MTNIEELGFQPLRYIPGQNNTTIARLATQSIVPELNVNLFAQSYLDSILTEPTIRKIDTKFVSLYGRLSVSRELRKTKPILKSRKHKSA